MMGKSQIHKLHILDISARKLPNNYIQNSIFDEYWAKS